MIEMNQPDPSRFDEFIDFDEFDELDDPADGLDELEMLEEFDEIDASEDDDWQEPENSDHSKAQEQHKCRKRDVGVRRHRTRKQDTWIEWEE